MAWIILWMYWKSKTLRHEGFLADWQKRNALFRHWVRHSAIKYVLIKLFAIIMVEHLPHTVFPDH